MADSQSIADYVREHYTDQGVEVEGTGSGRMRLRMPPEFHNVTEMSRDLIFNFDAVIDLVIDQQGSQNQKSCVVFEVYCEERPRRLCRRASEDEGEVEVANNAKAEATRLLAPRTPYMVYILPVLVTVAFHCVMQHVWKPAMAATTTDT